MMKKNTKNHFLNGLKRKRREIDLIDRKLLALLNHRLRVALKAGKIKKRMGEKIYNPQREREILKRLKTRNKGPLTEKDLEKIFRTIMGVSRRAQK